MGQSRTTRAEGAPDTVITGAVVLDHWGIVKADVGIRDGRITALGKAGNPETMDGVHPDLVIGPETEVIAGNGKILTAGAIDTHVHFICPQQVDEALASGVTTLVGGGTGPAEGSKATTITPGAWHIARLFESMDSLPVNVGLLGKGNTMSTASMRDQLRAASSASRSMRTGARPLPYSTPAWASARRAAPSSRSTPTPSTRPDSSATPSPPSPAAPSTRSTSRAPAAATPPT